MLPKIMLARATSGRPPYWNSYQSVTRDNIPSLERFQAIPNGRSRLCKVFTMKMFYNLTTITLSIFLTPAFSRAEVVPLNPSKQSDVQRVEPAQEQSSSNKTDEITPRLNENGLNKSATPSTNQPSDADVPRLRTNPDCLAAAYDFSDFDPTHGCVRDKSGNRFNLTLVGQPATAVDGIVDKGVMLNGGYFLAKGNPLAGADHFTISVWFKTAEPMNNYKLVSAAVWSGGNNASGWNVGTHYSEFWADGQEGSLRGGPGWERSTEFKKGEWNHLVLTYDGGYVREYINGKRSLKIRGTGLRVGDGAPMTVGAWMGGFQFRGVIDELRIYRRALKKREIHSLHTALPGRD
jgi:hypothetical protein